MSSDIYNASDEMLYHLYHKMKDPILYFDRYGSLVHTNKAFISLFKIDDDNHLKDLNLFHCFQINAYIRKNLNTKGSVTYSTTLDMDVFKKLSNIKTQVSGLRNVTLSIDKLSSGSYLMTIVKSFSFNMNDTFSYYSEQYPFIKYLTNVCIFDINLIEDSFHCTENFYDWFDMDLTYLHTQGRKIFDLVHADDYERVRKHLERYLIGVATEYMIDYRIKKNDYEYLTIRSTGKIIRDYNDKPIRFIGIMINATNQVKSAFPEDAIEDDLRQLFDKMEAGFVLHKMICDDSGNPVNFDFRYVNPAYERISGNTRDKVIGHLITEFVNPIKPELMEKFANAALQGTTMHFQDNLGNEGRYYDVITYQTRPYYFAVIYTDITHKVQAEEALSRAEKMNSIGQLAGGIAHDFNNHLQIIRSYSDLLAGEIESINASSMKGFIHKIQDSVNHSSHLIKQLLAFSKGGTFNSKNIDVHLLLHQIKSILGFSLNKDIHVQLLLHATSHTILGDEPMIQNALINLCLNSKDAMPNGGYIQIMTRNIRYEKETYLQNHLIEAGHYIVISIRDNGLGILKEDLEHIFEPFFTTKPSKGTGMGLAATLGTIQNHKGTITVSSVKEQWTCFDIYLPVTDCPVEFKNHKSHDQLSDFVPYHLMLVDDEPVIAMVIEQYLGKLGYSVMVFSSPTEAYEHIRDSKIRYDCFILDIIMPDMNGFELLSKIIEEQPSAKAIFLSGYFDPEDANGLLESHILDIIEKPVKLEELNHKIQSSLQS